MFGGDYMISGIQIIGIVFMIMMMYLTFVHYKRKSYGFKSLLLWLGVWIVALVVVSVPSTVYGIMQALNIQRTADFITLLGFAFFAVIIFYLYSIVGKNNQKMEHLVRELAINDAEKNTANSKNRKRRKN
jgi:hypothetical protein